MERDSNIRVVKGIRAGCMELRSYSRSVSLAVHAEPYHVYVLYGYLRSPAISVVGLTIILCAQENAPLTISMHECDATWVMASLSTS